ncbi:MAG: PDZ domain-containing protein [Candidatus Zhuqueibacterota bacterium]
MNKIILKSIFIAMVALVALLVASQMSAFASDKEPKKTGFLGVTVEELSRSMKKEFKAEFGVFITSISEESPADEYGLMEEDVIQYVDDVKIRRSSTLTRTIKKIKPGNEAKIQVIRDGSLKSINVKIGSMKNMSSFRVFNSDGPNLFSIYEGGGGYLGVSLFGMTEGLASYFNAKEGEGALILSVEEASPAEKANLKSGDVILKVDGEEVTSQEDVRDILREFEDGDEVKLVILRNKANMEVKVTLEKKETMRYFDMSKHNLIDKIKLEPYHDAIQKFHKELNQKSPKTIPEIKTEKRKTVIITDTI